ncbi:QWRF motif-containing protein 2-like isoform X1 [Punica granatum]|uniref:QWRF motif-containing protein 2-like isoform X1 n=2 Tax=Punica granatum TaxID=22663 RepID=A0A218WD48_PUNGR|nr:QWRF motif-containing protein 2-like isoform X1 [Punica granatum]OWM70794.1 hypothetical protein CDL15_Pgr014467 [Punica granatum]
MVTAVSTALSPKAAHQGGSRTAVSRSLLLPSDSDNAAAPRRPKGREVSSRYMSALSSNSFSPSTVKRSASPLISRTAASPAVSTPSPPAPPAAMKRSQSVQRRPVATPRQNLLDLRAGSGLNGRETAAQKVLFTSTRSLTVAFQGQSFSLQVSKTKPSPAATGVRRGTPERRKQAANYASSGAECADRIGKFAGSVNVVRALNDTMMKVSLTSNSPDLAKAVEVCSNRNPLRSDLQSEAFMDSDGESVTGSSDNTPKLSKKNGFENPLSSPKGALNSRRYQSPAHRPVWPPSPSKLATPAASTPARSASSMPSILCFAADLRSGRIGENRVADAHELRLLYNRLLQWRFVNARADSSLRAQELDALRSLFSARFITSKLRNSVKGKRIELQWQRHNLKLASILHWQMVSLEAWESMDKDYSDSLFGAIEALKASTLRLPVVAGARAEIQKVKDAVCSAADVMQAVLSSTYLLSTKVEEVNSLVLELLHAAAKESALLKQSRDLLSTVATMQVMECSLRTHMVQLMPRALSNFTDTSLGIASD